MERFFGLTYQVIITYIMWEYSCIVDDVTTHLNYFNTDFSNSYTIDIRCTGPSTAPFEIVHWFCFWTSNRSILTKIFANGQRLLVGHQFLTTRHIREFHESIQVSCTLVTALNKPNYTQSATCGYSFPTYGRSGRQCVGATCGRNLAKWLH